MRTIQKSSAVVLETAAEVTGITLCYLGGAMTLLYVAARLAVQV